MINASCSVIYALWIGFVPLVLALL